MIKVVPFEPSHIKTLEPDPEIHGHEDHKWLRKVDGSSFFVAATFLEKGKTLGIVGMYFATPTTARCWAILSSEIKKHPFSLYITVKKSIENAISLGKATNFEAQILKDKPVLKRWITKLGFSYSYSVGHYDIYDRRVS